MNQKLERQKRELPSKRFPEDEQLFASIDPIYTTLINKTATHLANGRWWNLWHTVLSVRFMKQIIASEAQQSTVKGNGVVLPEVLYPAIIFHDSGWDKDFIGSSKTLKNQIVPEDVNTRWDDPEFRLAHMDVGEQIALEVLNKVDYGSFLERKGIDSPQEVIDEIYQIVATHDNVYVPGKSGPQTINEKIHRDADACFIVTGVSFWKDYKVYKDKQIAEGKEAMSLQEYLEQKNNKYGKRETREGNRIFADEVEKRKKEITDNTRDASAWYDFYKEEAEARNQRASSGVPYIPTD